jgi:hypothetical protein
MDKILARWFSPFDFSVVPGFPNIVPTINEWGDYLPRFRGSQHDHPGEHLLNFHICMLEHNFVHQDVLMKMFRFSLEGDARDWFYSLPPGSISSLEQFHAVFNAHCQRYYPSDLIFHNCCEDDGCGLDQKSILSLPCPSALEEICIHCPSEESVEREFPSLETEDLDSPSEDDKGDSMAVEALSSTPDASTAFNFDDYSEDEQQSLSSYFDIIRGIQPAYDNYASDFELDVQDSQEHATEPYYYEEIDYPGPTETTEQWIEEQIFPKDPVYDDYGSDPWESYEEKEED